MCERACVHKVPPCKRLIVCVGNNSPIPQGMKQARKRPGPQTSGGPPGHGTPRRTTAGTTAASTQKGQRRARRRDLRQPQCRRPRVPWRQARRLHRQPTTPGRTGPWARRPKGPPPHFLKGVVDCFFSRLDCVYGVQSSMCSCLYFLKTHYFSHNLPLFHTSLSLL